MLMLSVVVIAFVSSANAAPREKRFDVYDSLPTFPAFPFTYAYIRPFGGGAFAGTGFPWMQPVPMYVPMPDFGMPGFRMPDFTPWYKGQNVCETKKIMEEPAEIKEWMSDGFEGSFDYSHESQNCRGNNDKYVCIRRIQTNDGAKMEMTRYECCYGFIRNTEGPGCVESSSATGTSPTEIKMKEASKYNIFKANYKSGDTSGVENVPVQ